MTFCPSFSGGSAPGKGGLQNAKNGVGTGRADGVLQGSRDGLSVWQIGGFPDSLVLATRRVVSKLVALPNRAAF